MTASNLVVDLADGRRVSVPLAWFPKLVNASVKDLRNFKLLGDGEGIHWPAIDEDLGVAGLLRGSSSLGSKSQRR